MVKAEYVKKLRKTVTMETFVSKHRSKFSFEIYRITGLRGTKRVIIAYLSQPTRSHIAYRMLFVILKKKHGFGQCGGRSKKELKLTN